MNKYKFTDGEIPYHILAKFSLTQEMIGDLPMHALEEINNGRCSPVLPIAMTDEQGNIVHSRTRFSLIRKEDGSVDVIFYPKLTQSNLDRFGEENQQKLQAGKPIIETLATPDGKQVQGFHQIDSGTGQILSVPTPVIGRNLQYIADEYHLSNAELTCLQRGEPLTVAEDNDLVTIGIDLRAPTGIRICTGDEQKWKEQNQKEWGKYNFGCFGCWMMDEEGNLDYIPEEEYSDELWEELKKRGMQRTPSTPKM